MRILKETKNYVLCVKPAGVLSEDSGAKRSVPLLLREAAAERGEAAEYYSVHRLDREVGGVMVYAKTKEYAAKLSEAIRERRVEKEYLAVVRGEVEEEGEWEDLLFRDSKSMKTYVVTRKRAGVREAKLAYKRIAVKGEGEERVSLVKVRLYTGRTHQIRVQFASRGHALAGDGRYGSGDGKDRPALFSCRLALAGEFDERAIPDYAPFDMFKEEIEGALTGK